jgi:serine/threonine-protein kinase HipA
VTHAFNPKGEWTYQHLMSVNGKFQGIACEDLLEEAERFGVRRPREILTDVRAAQDSWPEFALKAGLEPSLRDRVASDFRPL